MRIENEMLSRFSSKDSLAMESAEKSLSAELDFFFYNVMDTLLYYFTEKETIKV